MSLTTDTVSNQVNRPTRVGSSLPSTCKRGEIFFLVGTLNKLYASFAANTFTEISSAADAGTIVDAETPTGTIDGANLTFTLAHAPAAGTLKVYVNGILKALTTEYTISSTTLTMDISATPDIGNTFIVSYRY